MRLVYYDGPDPCDPMENKLPFTLRDTCRICKSSGMRVFLEFGPMPLAGGFLKPEEIHREIRIPLTIAFCPLCTEVQTLETVDAETLFRDYRFLASSTQTLSEHFRQYAATMKERFLTADSIVVEFGSNDGVLLRPFLDLGVRAIGFEPATNIAKVAMSRGCTVINDFFNLPTAGKMVDEFGKADLVCANNVLAHIDDMHEVMRAIDLVLRESGVFVFEVHYLLDLLETFQYDMMYHEHMMYHSLGPLAHLLDLFDLEIFDVERIPIHSGSIRVFAQRRNALNRRRETERLRDLRVLESLKQLGSFATYERFGADVAEKRDRLRRLIEGMVGRGKLVVGYGASGRATVHLNFSNLGTDLVPYVVDASPERISRVVPGTRSPIVPPEYFRADRPDYALVFAYNYLEEIGRKEKEFLERGGRFIVPLPEPRVVDQ